MKAPLSPCWDASAKVRLAPAEEAWRRALSLLDPLGLWVLEPMRRRGTYGGALVRAEQEWRKRRERGDRQSLAEWLERQGIIEPHERGRWVAERLGWSWWERKEAMAWEGRAERDEQEEVDGSLWMLIESLGERRWRVGVDQPERGTWERVERRLRQRGWQRDHAVEFVVVSGWSNPKGAVERKHTAGEEVFEELLAAAVEQGASDVHFVPREQCVDVRFRIDGRLWLHHVFGPEQKQEILAHAKMSGGLDIGRPGCPLDGAGKRWVAGRTFKLRYSSMPTQFGQQVVIRLLDQEAAVMPLDQLGLGDADRHLLEEAIRQPQGLIYLVGPTGCGKTTTLAALLNLLDGTSYALRTLENPIEYRLGHAVQAEVGPDLSFAEGLRALLRQDPDYLLVGETRDRETAEISIETGLTGHLCFSTLHANDAVGGIVRLLDLGVAVGPLLAACDFFVAQRLVRRLCRHCARPREDSAEQCQKLSIRMTDTERLWEPVGCAHCREGFRGRLAVYEIRRVAALADLIQREGAACAPSCRRRARALGWTSMFVDGLGKAQRGLTTLEEVVTQVPQLTFPYETTPTD